MYPIEKYQFKVYEHTNEDGSKSSVVIALSTYEGKVVKGIAKCIASDPFDLETGKRLAAARCDFKVCSKRKKKAEQKRHEVALRLEELTQYYVKMSNYYDDAIEEAFLAARRLNKIQDELR